MPSHRDLACPSCAARAVGARSGDALDRPPLEEIRKSEETIPAAVAGFLEAAEGCFDVERAAFEGILERLPAITLQRRFPNPLVGELLQKFRIE